MIRAEAITLLRGGDVLFEDSDLQVFPGHRVGLVGRNGCGKSSLFAMLRGELSADSGNIHLPAEWRIASVARDTPALDKSAIDYVMDGDAEFRQLEAQLAQAESDNNGEAIAHCHDKLASIGAYDIQPRTASLMAGLGFTQNNCNSR